MAEGRGEPFEATSPSLPDVRGVLHRPAGPAGRGLVLTHGAGGNADMPLLVALARAFAARGLTVLRCDLPFRQARRTGPPSRSAAPRDRDGLRHAVHAVGGLGARPVLLGGQSYGGRQASVLAADEPGLVAGLLLLSYPLHPPGQPKRLRTEHFPRLRVPVLFVHGTADPFGSLGELEVARALIPAPTQLLVTEGGHDLGWRRARPELADQIVAQFLRLIG